MMERGVMTTYDLDRLDNKTLMAFWARVHFHPVKTAREIFPKRRPRYVAATEVLGAYAANRAAMLTCKERNDKRGMSVYQHICDILKDDLPLWAD